MPEANLFKAILDLVCCARTANPDGHGGGAVGFPLLGKAPDDNDSEVPTDVGDMSAGHEDKDIDTANSSPSQGSPTPKAQMSLEKGMKQICTLRRVLRDRRKHSEEHAEQPAGPSPQADSESEDCRQTTASCSASTRVSTVSAVTDPRARRPSAESEKEAAPTSEVTPRDAASPREEQLPKVGATLSERNLKNAVDERTVATLSERNLKERDTPSHAAAEHFRMSVTEVDTRRLSNERRMSVMSSGTDVYAQSLDSEYDALDFGDLVAASAVRHGNEEDGPEFEGSDSDREEPPANAGKALEGTGHAKDTLPHEPEKTKGPQATSSTAAHQNTETVALDAQPNAKTEAAKAQAVTAH